MSKFNTMGKVELRAACKAAGIPYGKLNNDGMRAALSAKSGPVPGPAKVTHSVRAKTAGEVVVQKSLKIEKDRPSSNGIKRPSAGSICREIWDALDRSKAKLKAVPTFENVRDLMVANSWQRNTAYTQFQRWKQFNKAAVIGDADDGEGEEE